MSKQTLSGCCILILEDDFYQAQDAVEILEDAGATIVCCRATSFDVAELRTLGTVNVAMLDVNLGGKSSFEFARLLKSRDIPCIFVTGYDANMLPTDLSSVPVLTKPVDEALVVDEIRALWKPASAIGGGAESNQENQ